MTGGRFTYPAALPRTREAAARRGAWGTGR